MIQSAVTFVSVMGWGVTFSAMVESVVLLTV